MTELIKETEREATKYENELRKIRERMYNLGCMTNSDTNKRLKQHMDGQEADMLRTLNNLYRRLY